VKVEYFVTEYGVDIIRENEDDESLLFNACESGNKDLVKYLLENGADINKDDILGETVLFDACESGNKDLVKYLL